MLQKAYLRSETGCYSGFLSAGCPLGAKLALLKKNKRLKKCIVILVICVSIYTCREMELV